MEMQIRRGSARFTERAAGRMTHHAFSFGASYDPERLSFGSMVCHDDHVLGSGRGFDTHRHSDLVIVSTVLDGALRHDGPDGDQVLRAGDVGVLRTGDGVEHAEHATDDGPCRFVQVWLRAADDGRDRAGAAPSYEVRRDADGVDVPGGRLDVVRLDAGERHLIVTTAPRAHVFVATGALLRFSLAEPLEAGDAMLLEGDPDVEAREGGADGAPATAEVVAAVPTTLLVWQLRD